MTDEGDALTRSLVPPDRLRHDPDRTLAEPSAVTAGGMVASHRARIMSPVELMERRGVLTWRQAHAGRRLYRSFALGIELARDQDAAGGAWSPGGLTDAQLGAAEDYEASRRAVGPMDWRLVEAIVLLEITVRDWVAIEHQSNSGRTIAFEVERLRRALDRIAADQDGEEEDA
jgi:hypothetical protein